MQGLYGQGKSGGKYPFPLGQGKSGSVKGQGKKALLLRRSGGKMSFSSSPKYLIYLVYILK